MGISMKNTSDGRKNIIGRYWKKAVCIFFWLSVWQLVTLVVGNEILLSGPWETLCRLAGLLGQPDFYRAVGASLIRIGTGFVCGALFGILSAAVASRFLIVRQLLAPLMSLLKTVPVASFVVILLIWWGSSFLAAVISFLVVLPNVYLNTLEGLKNTDRDLLEMAEVFGLPFSTRFFYIFRPSLRPFLNGALKLSLGMSWKSGIAAEVIGTPAHSAGSGIYMSKIYLDTAGVFAWTAAVVIVSVVFERIFLGMADAFFRWQPRCVKPRRTKGGFSEVYYKNLEKSYDLPGNGGRRQVIAGSSAVCGPGVHYITGPSGSGKTTLLMLLAGLRKPDSGVIKVPARVSMMFQEDRLCMELTALKNVEMVTGSRAEAEKALLCLLSCEDLEKPCSDLSGGMKRRVSLARAMEAQSELVLLDEPFTGLDEENRRRAMDYIMRRGQGRILIIAAHDTDGVNAEGPC